MLQQSATSPLRVRAEATLRESNERFKTVMDSLDAFVYVADMKTHEILFLNLTGRNIWGDVTGRPCWNFFQPCRNGPCSFCTNDKLVDADGNPTGVLVWEIRNTVNGRWYECARPGYTVDGRQAGTDGDLHGYHRSQARGRGAGPGQQQAEPALEYHPARYPEPAHLPQGLHRSCLRTDHRRCAKGVYQKGDDDRRRDRPADHVHTGTTTSWA